MYFSEEKKPCIDDQTFRDLQNIEKYLPENKESSIVIASHGMEFWTAWALNVKVGQDRAMDKIGLDKYINVILLQQKNEEKQGPPGGKPLHKTGKEWQAIHQWDQEWVREWGVRFLKILS